MFERKYWSLAPVLMSAVLYLALMTIAQAQTPPAPEPNLAALRAKATAEPKDGAAQYAFALALQKASKHRDAITAFDRAAALNFQASTASLRAAQSQVALGDSNAAIKRVQAVGKSQPFALASILKAIGGIPQLASDPQFQATLAAADAQRYPCRDRPESRQFDFWIGDWNVSDPSGQPLGVSSIASDLEGCVIRESWIGGHGGRGTSVNFYDPASKQWHQVWTDDSGVVTNYVGELRDGAMRFRAEGFGDADGVHHQRMLDFIPSPDGSVRQRFQDSDDGKTWKTTFDGIYVRATK